MIKQNFIRTSDSATAEKLRVEGLYEVQSTDSKYFVFVNPGTMNFTEANIDMNKINYTNNISI